MTDRPVPEIVLERARLGELSPPEQEALTRRAEAEPALRERLAALDRSDEELRRRLGAAALATRVRERLAAGAGDRETGAWWRAWPLPAGLAVAATAVLVLSLRTIEAPPRGDEPPAVSAPGSVPKTPAAVVSDAPAPRRPVAPTPASEPGVRTKGLGPTLSLFRKTPSGSETLADGDLAREGDVIRIGYRPLGRHYGVIVSLDGRGGVTRHLPERGGSAAVLQGSEVVLLAHAYQLDDAPDWERFFFVTADAPFPVATVEDAARRVAGTAGAAAGLPLPQTLEQSAFLLTKERRP